MYTIEVDIYANCKSGIPHSLHFHFQASKSRVFFYSFLLYKLIFFFDVFLLIEVHFAHVCKYSSVFFHSLCAFFFNLGFLFTRVRQFHTFYFQIKKQIFSNEVHEKTLVFVSLRLPIILVSIHSIQFHFCFCLSIIQIKAFISFVFIETRTYYSHSFRLFYFTIRLK